MGAAGDRDAGAAAAGASGAESDADNLVGGGIGIVVGFLVAVFSPREL